MSTRHDSHRSSNTSRLVAVAIAAVALAAAAAGLTTLGASSAHPTRHASAMPAPRAAQPAAADTSVPSASDVLRIRTPGLDDLPPTF